METQVIRTLKSRQPGTQKYYREWGDKLIAVRYRTSPSQNKLFTTIEIIVDERDKLPADRHQRGYLARKQKSIVAIRVDFRETDLRARIKEKGARWSQQLKLWLLPYKQVTAMGLRERIVTGAAEACEDIDTSIHRYIFKPQI